MAPNSTKFPSKPSLLFLLLITLFIHSTSSSSSSPHHLKETKMTVYIHDFVTGPNMTLVNVAGIPASRWSFSDFGSVYVTDDIVKEGPSPNSNLLGRAQGIYVVSSLDGVNHYWTASLVFSNKAYNGSTLEIQGRFASNLAVSEYSVVSGTGKFRFARGYIACGLPSPSVIEGSIIYAVQRCDITIRLG